MSEAIPRPIRSSAEIRALTFQDAEPTIEEFIAAASDGQPEKLAQQTEMLGRLDNKAQSLAFVAQLIRPDSNVRLLKAIGVLADPSLSFQAEQQKGGQDLYLDYRAQLNFAFGVRNHLGHDGSSHYWAIEDYDMPFSYEVCKTRINDRYLGFRDCKFPLDARVVIYGPSSNHEPGELFDPTLYDPDQYSHNLAIDNREMLDRYLALSARLALKSTTAVETV